MRVIDLAETVGGVWVAGSVAFFFLAAGIRATHGSGARSWGWIIGCAIIWPFSLTHGLTEPDVA